MNHEKIEKHAGLMIVLILIVISFGGLAEIVPLLFSKESSEPLLGVKPYTALQLEGRDIYIREGCSLCHTQMIRVLRSDTQRYGHYTMAGEDVYEHPFLWGSKRIGPDLMRVGGRYSDDWHRIHLSNPRDVVPGSVMPSYAWLADNKIDGSVTPKKMRALRIIGVPYTDEQINNAQQAVKDKTEMDALVAYLQSLGTMVDLSEGDQ